MGVAATCYYYIRLSLLNYPYYKSFLVRVPPVTASVLLPAFRTFLIFKILPTCYMDLVLFEIDNSVFVLFLSYEVTHPLFLTFFL